MRLSRSSSLLSAILAGIQSGGDPCTLFGGGHAPSSDAPSQAHTTNGASGEADEGGEIEGDEGGIPSEGQGKGGGGDE